MREYDLNNQAAITGRVLLPYTLHHTIYEERFFNVFVEIKRNSEKYDIVPIIVSEKILNKDLRNKSFLTFTGQIRSHNDENGKVNTYMFAKDVIEAKDGEYNNSVELIAIMCKKGTLKTTPSGRRIISFIAAANRAYNKSDYIPVVAWGSNSKFIESMDIATKLKVTGRYQSREYFKKDDEGNKTSMIAYEISSSNIVNLSDREGDE